MSAFISAGVAVKRCSQDLNLSASEAELRPIFVRNADGSWISPRYFRVALKYVWSQIFGCFRAIGLVQGGLLYVLSVFPEVRSIDARVAMYVRYWDMVLLCGCSCSECRKADLVLILL